MNSSPRFSKEQNTGQSLQGVGGRGNLAGDFAGLSADFGC